MEPETTHYWRGLIQVIDVIGLQITLCLRVD